MNTPLYGYDRYMKPICHGSIIRFREAAGGRLRVGHVWQGRDYMSDDENAVSWNVSFNHPYSETSYSLRAHPIVAAVVIGRIGSDEGLLALDTGWNSSL